MTLGEVRTSIDRPDRVIVRLIAEPSDCVHEVAWFKANPAQVQAPEREDAIVRQPTAERTACCQGSPKRPIVR
jgi:isochorismate pyruvate lyase